MYLYDYPPAHTLAHMLLLLLAAGGKHKNWRRRWFILTDNCLYYFKSPSDKEPRGIIPLVNLEVHDCPDNKRNVRLAVQCD